METRNLIEPKFYMNNWRDPKRKKIVLEQKSKDKYNINRTYVLKYFLNLKPLNHLTANNIGGAITTRTRKLNCYGCLSLPKNWLRGNPLPTTRVKNDNKNHTEYFFYYKVYKSRQFFFYNKYITDQKTL